MQQFSATFWNVYRLHRFWPKMSIVGFIKPMQLRWKDTRKMSEKLWFMQRWENFHFYSERCANLFLTLQLSQLSKCVLPRLAVMSQSNWSICRFRQEYRQHCSLQHVTSWDNRSIRRRHCSKKQIDCGLAWSLFLSTTVFFITVVKICGGLIRLRLANP